MSKVLGPIEVASIARVCHEANRAYCVGLGDLSQSVWEGAYDWQRDSVITGVTFALATDRKPEELHAAWMEDKLKAGWTYATVKNVDKKQSPYLVGWGELAESQKTKDKLFLAICNVFRGGVL